MPLHGWKRTSIYFCSNQKKYIEIDQNGFDFESSLIEDLIVNGEIQEHDLKRDFINATKNRIRCKNALCKLYSQDPDIIQNFMPSISLSKWLKFLLFENGGIKYDKFIFNEAGHIIPKCWFLYIYMYILLL